MKDALAQALQTGDFKNLNDLVTQTVTNALNEVGKHIPFENNENQPDHPNHSASFSQNFSRDYAQTSSNHNTGNPSDSYSGTHAKDEQSGTYTWDRKAAQAQQEREEQRRLKQQQQWQEHWQRTQEQLLQKKEQFLQQKDKFLHPRTPDRQTPGQVHSAPPVKFNKTGSVSNILYKVFGGIGLGVTGILFFVQLILWGANIPVNGAGIIANLLFIAVFFGMIQHGIGQGKRLKRARRYLQLCSSKMYIATEALAESTGKSKRYVLRDLQKMLKLGMFPEGHLDKQKTHFMLNDAIYRQYLETEENHRRMELNMQKNSTQMNPADTNVGQGTGQSKNLSSEKDSPSSAGTDSEKTELNTMIAEGTECIYKLRNLNEQIPGEVISKKLSRLESLLKEIFDNLKEHPDQMHRMHKLMDYYLPTTLKLVEAYADFDKVSAPGEEITAAKAEIENTLDTINQAFTELLNNLFQDAVLDVTTDAQVLKTMLAREGLMNEMDIKR